MIDDVFYGDTEKPLPDWRTKAPEVESDDDNLTADELAGVVGVLGFDPEELAKTSPP